MRQANERFQMAHFLENLSAATRITMNLLNEEKYVQTAHDLQPMQLMMIHTYNQSFLKINT